MNDDLWQVPLLVMAGIILVELLIMALARRGWWPGMSPRVRTAALGLLALLGLGVGIKALGPDLADQLASVAAAVATLAALVLTWQSHKAPAVPTVPTVPPTTPEAPVNDGSQT